MQRNGFAIIWKLLYLNINRYWIFSFKLATHKWITNVWHYDFIHVKLRSARNICCGVIVILILNLIAVLIIEYDCTILCEKLIWNDGIVKYTRINFNANPSQRPINAKCVPMPCKLLNWHWNEVRESLKIPQPTQNERCVMPMASRKKFLRINWYINFVWIASS